MTTKNLLVELFVEELPPKALKKLGDAFATVLADQLKAQGLAPAETVVTAFASPRRLAAHVTAVAQRASCAMGDSRPRKPPAATLTDTPLCCHTGMCARSTLNTAAGSCLRARAMFTKICRPTAG